MECNELLMGKRTLSFFRVVISTKSNDLSFIAPALKCYHYLLQEFFIFFFNTLAAFYENYKVSSLHKILPKSSTSNVEP